MQFLEWAILSCAYITGIYTVGFSSHNLSVCLLFMHLSTPTYFRASKFPWPLGFFSIIYSQSNVCVFVLEHLFCYCNWLVIFFFSFLSVKIRILRRGTQLLTSLPEQCLNDNKFIQESILNESNEELHLIWLWNWGEWVSKEQRFWLSFLNPEKCKVHNWPFIQKYTLTYIKIFFDSTWESMFQFEKWMKISDFHLDTSNLVKIFI